ncbi:MAG: EpsG family protein [Bacteroidales bacterium]|nr:EpsG family protein [Bacteroidales bacterium]
MIFWLVAGLRYETGVDWPGYTKFFVDSESIGKVLKNAVTFHFYDQYEFGYTLLNSVLRTFTDNVQWLFLIIAFSTNLMLFNSVKRYSDHIFISLLIYFGTIYFILDMSGIRQCIALNIFLLSIKYITGRHFLKYFVTILIASMFHITSLLLIPIYFILKIKFNNWVLLSVIIAGLFISVFKITWIIPFLKGISELIQIEAITNRIYAYSNLSGPRIFGFGFLFNFLVFIFCIIERKKLEQNKMFNIFLNMYVISLFFYYFTWELNEFSSRFRLYFTVGNIVLFTYFLDVYKNKLNRFLVFFMIVSFSVFFGRIYFFEMQQGIAYNPYQNYLIYKVFGLKSTGQERLEKFIIIFNK